MKQKISLFAIAIITVAACIALESFSKKPGGDYFKIFLNDRLMTEQYLTQPTNLSLFSLSAANRNDKLTIHFSHCGTAGKNRAISLKDEKGNLLKEWKFADSKSIALQIEVRDVLQATSAKSICTVFYSSKERPSGQALTKLDLKKASVARL
ncbi:MAG TPA: hypothetical protein VM871_10295 [Flavisolibacter sp.]|nr:hypothetical protein [Flavisolibacter sp.]